MLAYLLEKAERCSLCGTAPWEWEEDRFAYEAVYDHCQGCEKKELLRETPEKVRAGSSITLLPRRAAARLRQQAHAAQMKRKERDG